MLHRVHCKIWQVREVTCLFKRGNDEDAANQKQIEKALNDGEQLFRLVAENSFTGILIADENFKIIYCNEEIERIGSYSKEEIIGQDFRKYLHKDSKALVQQRFLNRQRGEYTPPHYEFKIVKKNGDIREVDVKASVIKHRFGKRYTLVQIVDITDRRKMEKERTVLEQSLSALNIYGQSLNMAKTTKQVYELTLDAADKTLGFEIASILIIEGKMLRLAAQRGYRQRLTIKLPLDWKKGITVRAARKGSTVYVPDVTKDEAYFDATSAIRSECNQTSERRVRAKKILSELAVPIKVGNNVLGVLNVESKKIAGFDEKDRKLLEMLASHAATAMSNLRRHAQLRDISEKIACLMRNTTEVMNVKHMRQKLKVITKAIRKFGWRRAVISLRDENLEGTDLVTSGLTKEEIKLLLERKAPGRVWKERLGPKFDQFKVGEFYYLPWTDPWIRENVHGVSPETPIEDATTYAGVPSQRSLEEMVNWHPQDMIYAPLRTPSGRIVGILSMDDPVDGQMPTEESLSPLALFLHQAAMIIENAQLIQSLREARERLEQKVDERTRELKKSQEQLLKAQRLAVIGELAGMVGHDLRNPLTSIAGATYFLKKRSNLTDRKTAEMLELVEKNISYSNKIINDLLEYSREIKLDVVERSPKSMMSEALSIVEKPNNIQIVDLTKPAPRMIVDPEKLKRAFVNLIKNAFDAMPSGGTLTITSKKANGNMQVQFSDSGLGMKKRTMEKLWTPLFTTKAKGMGFGLPICKRIIDAHGGSINVRSVFGKGTTFTVTLPLKQKIEEGGEAIWMMPPESSLLTMTKT
jgi:PAS domain S-box-containing protein